MYRETGYRPTERHKQEREAEFRKHLIQKMKNEEYGFITKEMVKRLVKIDPHYMVLIRCGGCRFTCPAQHVDHVVEIFNASNEDYVRDVSFIAS